MQDDIFSPVPEENLFPSESFRDDEFRSAFGEGDELKRAFGDDVPPKPTEPEPKSPEKKEPPVKKAAPKEKGNTVYWVSPISCPRLFGSA